MASQNIRERGQPAVFLTFSMRSNHCAAPTSPREAVLQMRSQNGMATEITKPSHAVWLCDPVAALCPLLGKTVSKGEDCQVSLCLLCQQLCNATALLLQPLPWRAGSKEEAKKVRQKNCQAAHHQSGSDPRSDVATL